MKHARWFERIVGVVLIASLVGTFVAAVTLVAAVGQEPPERRDDKYKADPHAYCYQPATSGSQVARRQRDPSAHQCACHLICQRDEAGTIYGDHEDGTCELYCTRQRCTCHVEEPCEGHH